MQELTRFISHQLNESQRSAVEHGTGPLLVIAGAGSGKTRVITTRIAHLIRNKQVVPESILALTFTNKAAAEMKERVKRYIEFDQPLPFIGTFHSYCVRLLRQYGNYLSYPFETILDEDDKRSLIDQIIKRANLTKQLQARTVSYIISQAKNQSITHDYQSLTEQGKQIPEIWELYEREKRTSKCYDFDDLLGATARLFAQHETLKAHHHARVRHILIDEYQDTNVVQNEILKLLTLDSEKQFNLESLCAVGDEDQSIYSWRGATVTNILNFPKQFSNTRMIKVEENFRSVQPILKSANNLIANNSNRNPKTLWSKQEANDRIRVINCSSERHEADVIIQTILQLKSIKQEKIGILYRSHYLSRSIEEALVRSSIPYKIIGNTQFYERKEVKDILAYAKLALNPFDRTAFLRCINCPSRGLGQKFVQDFFLFWDENHELNALEMAQTLLDQEKIRGLKACSVTTFINILADINSQTPAVDALKSIIQATGYLDYLKEQCPEAEAQARTENIRELISAAQYAMQQQRGSLQAYLEDIALVQNAIHEDEVVTNPVYVMTVHAAKGLEFDAVIVAGMEQGILPGSQALYNNQAIEEERRLFYVAITRARNYLLLTHCNNRYRFGTVQAQGMSQFLSELPSQYAQCSDLSELPNYQIKQYARTWLGKITHSPATTKVNFTFSDPFAEIIQPATKTVAEVKTTSWKANQPVKHQTFGVGIVKSINNKNNGKIVLTVSFKAGTKKIDASFLQPL